eukprot:gene5059-10130_t
MNQQKIITKVKPIVESRMYLGQVFDVLDEKDIWCEAETFYFESLSSLQVFELDDSKGRILFSYLHKKDSYDEWINYESGRIAPHHAYTYYEGGPYKIGQHIDFKLYNFWTEAFIENVLEDNTIKIRSTNGTCLISTMSTCNIIKPYGSNHINYISGKHTRIWKLPKLGNFNSTKLGDMSPTKDNISKQEITAADDYLQFVSSLQSQKMKLAPIPESNLDLYQAISHQIYNSDQYYPMIKNKCIEYVELQKDFFSQYIEGGQDKFSEYIDSLRNNNNNSLSNNNGYNNENIDDIIPILALCELYERPIDIWIYDSIQKGATSMRRYPRILPKSKTIIVSLQLSYYRGHYGSLSSNISCSGKNDSFYTSPAVGVTENKVIRMCRDNMSKTSLYHTNTYSSISNRSLSSNRSLTTTNATAATATTASSSYQLDDIMDRLNMLQKSIQRLETLYEYDRKQQQSQQQHVVSSGSGSGSVTVKERQEYSNGSECISPSLSINSSSSSSHDNDNKKLTVTVDDNPCVQQLSSDSDSVPFSETISPTEQRHTNVVVEIEEMHYDHAGKAIKPKSTYLTAISGAPTGGSSTDNNTFSLDTLYTETKYQSERIQIKLLKLKEKDQISLNETKQVQIDNKSEEEMSKVGKEVEYLQTKLKDLNILIKNINEHKSLPHSTENIFASATDLGIIESLVSKAEREKKKSQKQEKSKVPAARIPYYTYTSTDGIAIQVGRAASDNDILSCDARYRDNNDWWLHSAGCAGSHVVIRNTDDNLPMKFKETLMDAALLTAVNSKAVPSSKVPITYTRCKYISKPMGAKPGLVRIASGADVGTIYVDVKNSVKRLEKLMTTKT